MKPLCLSALHSSLASLGSTIRKYYERNLLTFWMAARLNYLMAVDICFLQCFILVRVLILVGYLEKVFVIREQIAAIAIALYLHTVYSASIPHVTSHLAF